MALRELGYDIDFRARTGNLRRIDNEVLRLDRHMDDVSGSVSRVERGISGINVGNIAVGIAGILSLREAVDQTLNFVSAAAKAQDDSNVFALSMGNLSNEATEFADTLAMDVGRGIFETRNNLGRLQDTLFGFTDGTEQSRKNVLQLSESILASTIDLNSQKDAFRTDEEAIQAMTSGLVGNHEALRRMGVVLTETNLDLQAQSLGLKGSFRDMDPLTKLTVRYAEVLKQSQTAIGDAERTSGDYNNRIRALHGVLQDVRVEVGGELIPIFTDLANTVIENKDGIKGFAEDFVAVSGSIARVIGPTFEFLADNVDEIEIALAGLGATFVALKLAPTIIAIGGAAQTAGFGISAFAGGAATLGEAFAFVSAELGLAGATIGGIAAGPVLIAIAAVGALTAAGVALYKNWDTVSDFFLDSWNRIKEGTEGAVNDVIDEVNLLIGVLNRIPLVDIGEVGHIDIRTRSDVVREENQAIAQRVIGSRYAEENESVSILRPSDTISNSRTVNNNSRVNNINSPVNITVNSNSGNADEIASIVRKEVDNSFGDLHTLILGPGL